MTTVKARALGLLSFSRTDGSVGGVGRLFALAQAVSHIRQPMHFVMSVSMP
ncbi:MAG: hypothetical protein ACYC66_02625 [Chloroflexota bacterium]